VSFFLAFASAVLFGCSRDNEKIPIIEQKCGHCHSASIVYERKRTVEEWNRLIHGMKMRGLVLTENEEKEGKAALEKKLILKSN
jgi:hypothetical protein